MLTFWISAAVAVTFFWLGSRWGRKYERFDQEIQRLREHGWTVADDD